MTVYDEIRIIRRSWPLAYIRKNPNCCFYVDFLHKTNDKYTTLRSFSFKNRSREHALLLAKIYRDWQYVILRRKHYITPFRKLCSVFSENMRESKYEKIGICRSKSFSKSNNRIETMWIAQWVEYIYTKSGNIKRKNRTKKFAVGRRSDEEAKQLAIEYRKKMESYLQSQKHQRIRFLYYQRKH